MLDTSEASVNSPLRRARAAFDGLPATSRERAPLPNPNREREVVSRLATPSRRATRARRRC